MREWSRKLEWQKQRKCPCALCASQKKRKHQLTIGNTTKMCYFTLISYGPNEIHPRLISLQLLSPYFWKVLVVQRGYSWLKSGKSSRRVRRKTLVITGLPVSLQCLVKFGRRLFCQSRDLTHQIAVSHSWDASHVWSASLENMLNKKIWSNLFLIRGFFLIIKVHSCAQSLRNYQTLMPLTPNSTYCRQFQFIKDNLWIGFSLHSIKQKKKYVLYNHNTRKAYFEINFPWNTAGEQSKTQLA